MELKHNNVVNRVKRHFARINELCSNFEKLEKKEGFPRSVARTAKKQLRGFQGELLDAKRAIDLQLNFPKLPDVLNVYIFQFLLPSKHIDSINLMRFATIPRFGTYMQIRYPGQEHPNLDEAEFFFKCAFCQRLLERYQCKRCGKCKAVFYCGVHCQMQDHYTRHRSECMPMRAVTVKLDDNLRLIDPPE
jgi:hypothetical protein